jgi:uncharacterized alkaline shock family protein YloU
MSQPETISNSAQPLPVTGEVRVSPRVTTALVTRAVAATDGIHTLEEAPSALLVRNTAAGLAVEVAVWIADGSPIEATAAALEQRLRADLGYALGRPVATVRVYVRGLRERGDKVTR